MKKQKFSILALLTTAPLWVSAEHTPDNIHYKPDTVTSRERPEVAPLGARAGAFRLYPSLTLSESYNDNIFSTDNNEESDFITLIRPALNLESLWGRHNLSLHADATLGRYGDNGSENFDDYSAGFDGIMEIDHAQSIYTKYNYLHGHENRSSPDNVSGIEPTELDSNTFNATYRNRFNRIIFELGGEYSSVDFDDARLANNNIINNDDRDRDRQEGSVKLGYEYLPEYTAYIRTSVNKVNYDEDTDGFGFNRDSDGYAFSVGTDLDLSGVLLGNLYVGYEKQQYDDLLLRDAKGISGGASLIWLPSQMTTVTSSLTRSIEETTLASSSGYFSTGANIVVDHELLRNLLLQARLNLSQDDFEGIDRSDSYFGSGLGATYMLNRHFYLLLDYDYLQRDSDSVTNFDDFSENIFSLGGRLQL